MKLHFLSYSFLLLVFFNSRSFGMENPYKGTPMHLNPDVSVSNSSQFKVTGWLQKQLPKSRRETFSLLPLQTTTPNHINRSIFGFLASIHAGHDVYALFVSRAWNLEFCIEGAPYEADGHWHVKNYLVQQVPLAAVKQLAIINVKDNGKAVLVTPGYKPQDGRPDVKLQVYQELTGHEAYVTPEYILGVCQGYSAEELQQNYDAFVSQWNEHYSSSQHSADIFKLILWAKRRLEERLKA